MCPAPALKKVDRFSIFFTIKDGTEGDLQGDEKH